MLAARSIPQLSQIYRAVPAVVLLGACLAIGSVSRAGEPTVNRFEKEILKFEEQDRLQPPPQGAVLFVGSSSIRLWDLKKSFPDLAVINRGFGGSQLPDSVYFAERIVIPYQPRLIVLYAGDNDIATGRTADQVFADLQAFVEIVHKKLPETRTLFLAVKPSLSRWKKFETQVRANSLVEEFAKKNDRLIYVDIVTPMLGKDGLPRPELFAKDGLHLSPAGYQVWADTLKSHLGTETENPGQ